MTASRYRLVLLVLVTAVYLPVLQNGFVHFDDGDYVFANPVVAQGLTWHGVIQVWREPMIDNYHPLTMMSHMIDVTLFGMNPKLHHAVSLCLHLCLVVLLFAFVRRIISDDRISFFVALLFGVHPLNVENVAWIAERKSLLCGLMMLLCLLAYHSWATRKVRSGLVLAHLALAAGLLCKSMLVTLPFVLLVLDAGVYGRLDRLQRHLWKMPVIEKSGMFVMVGGMALLTALIQPTQHVSRPVVERMQHVWASYAINLKQLLAPGHLTVLYPYTTEHMLAYALIGFFVIGLVSLFLWHRRLLQPATGWLWYLGMLVPVSGIVPLGYHLVTDRYAYLPMIGFWFGLMAFVNRRWPQAKWITVVTCIYVAVLGTQAHRQAKRWRNSETLFTYTLKHTQRNFVVAMNLAQTRMNEGRFRDALPLLEDARQWAPESARAELHLGWCKFGLGDATGIEEMESAVRRNALVEHGSQYLVDAYMASDRFEDACPILESLLAEAPGQTDLRVKLAICQAHLGRNDEAERTFQKAVELDPASYDAHFNYAVWLSMENRSSTAIDFYRKSLELRDTREARYGLAKALAEVGNREAATALLRHLLLLDPSDRAARRLLCELDEER
ncbi:MAG: tetratricopeptide repeat protein [Acidobacteria bacterium]|nr:tetratricopeptide repeat protein [Acidobacteriota bacterium]